MKLMKKWKMFIFIFLLYSSNTLARLQVMDKIIAIVNNNVVLESDVNMLLTSLKLTAYNKHQQLPDDPTLRSQILERLIMDNIILQLAMRSNISISEAQLDQAITNTAAQHHMTLEQLRNHLAHNGINYDVYRTQFRKEIMITEIRNREVHRRIKILPQEIDSLAKQISAQTDNSLEFNLNHLLIPLPKTPTPCQLVKAKALATSLVEQSKNGADFGKLAITYPDEVKSEQMGWNKAIELQPLFAERLQDVQKDSIIGPIRSNVGFHILKVNEIRGCDQKIAITEVQLQHILLRTSVMMTDQQAYAKLVDIAQQIKRGCISFHTAAKQISEDPDSANQGGELGWSSLAKFDPAFQGALIHLSKGEISDPIHSSYGWHLIRLIDTRQVTPSDGLHKDHVYHLLFNQKFVEEAQNWMQEKYAASYVKILDTNES